MTTQDTEHEIGRLTAALGDVTRRRVFFALRDAGRDCTKDDVAATVAIDRRLAGFHLDKLVEYGFATADLGRARDASGPGRPPKRYRVAPQGVLVARPERHYELLATLLLRATQGGGAGDADALERVGFDFGMEMGLAELAAGSERPSGESLARAVEGVARMLTGMGFAADTESGPGGLALRACACPFEELAFHDHERICGLDRSIWRGMIAAFAPEARITDDRTRAAGDVDCRVTVEGIAG